MMGTIMRYMSNANIQDEISQLERMTMLQRPIELSESIHRELANQMQRDINKQTQITLAVNTPVSLAGNVPIELPSKKESDIFIYKKLLSDINTGFLLNVTPDGFELLNVSYSPIVVNDNQLQKIFAIYTFTKIKKNKNMEI